MPSPGEMTLPLRVECGLVECPRNEARRDGTVRPARSSRSRPPQPTNLCTPLAPQNRGLTTALVEREDFAAGTSSRSTKLVHGGVRYLEKVCLCRRWLFFLGGGLGEPRKRGKGGAGLLTTVTGPHGWPAQCSLLVSSPTLLVTRGGGGETLSPACSHTPRTLCMDHTPCLIPRATPAPICHSVHPL